ncbi:MAG: hypothetical protein AMJ54_06325 [Deltaproteobacteria bacterium SG8_13]|nr:MAG: hypothetical protein AMJ54_06325 [Deltaproteobacteria bacterium SG8_13]
MSKEIKIDIDTFKVVTHAVAQSDNLEIMAGHLAQLLVGMLGIKGCSVFVRNVETDELEPLATFGLSIQYVNKGPVLSEKSISRTIKGEPIVISDISETDLLQYPREAQEEGIRAIVSLPIKLYGRVIGALRLYHRDQWQMPRPDIDSLMLLAEIVGLAMTYTRLLNAMRGVKAAVDDIHSVWLGTQGV